MDVLFINTIDFSISNIAPPLGLYSLKNTLLRETELKTSVINFDYLNKIGEFSYCEDIEKNIKMMANYIFDYHAKVVSFYTMCNSYAITLYLARLLKERDNNIIITFGGPQASLCAEESLNSFPFIDLIGIGEGELYISKLMNALIRGDDYTSIKGIAYRTKNGVVIEKYPDLIPSDRLGDYTVMDFDDILLDHNILKLIRYFPLEAGRGCPFSCTFCSTSIFWGRKFRIKPVQVLISEMKSLNKRYGITSFSLEHDMFTVNKNYLMDYCNSLIEQNLGFTWACSSRIDTLDEESMILMKKSGCKAIYMGIETGSQELQKIVNKNLKLDRALDKILKLKQFGFDLTISFIYGFPEEKIEHLRDTIKMIQDLLLNNINTVQLHLFIALPNTYETTKIANRVFFDRSEIEQSVYVANRFNSLLEKMIIDYKNVFIQYYTFDSPIRTRYKRLDFLVTVFIKALRIYKYSARFILNKYFLLDIYEKYSKVIEREYSNINNFTISDDFQSGNRKNTIYSIVQEIIDDEINNTSNESLIDIYKFEQKVFDYKLNNIDEAIILFSKYDIFSAFTKDEAIKKDTFAAIRKVNSEILVEPLKVSEDIQNIIAYC